MTVTLEVGPETVDLVNYRPHIEAALAYASDTHTYDDVAAMIAAGSAHAWPGPASVLITEIIDFPRKRVLNVFLAGGNMAELEVMMPTVLDWARKQGCTRAVFAGRPGWSRVAPIKHGGWTEELIVFAKELG